MAARWRARARMVAPCRLSIAATVSHEHRIIYRSLSRDEIVRTGRNIVRHSLTIVRRSLREETAMCARWPQAMAGRGANRCATIRARWASKPLSRAPLVARDCRSLADQICDDVRLLMVRSCRRKFCGGGAAAVAAAAPASFRRSRDGWSDFF
ncbi:hypothetical protein F511_45987 [Dorcoceras hygrometricum]|uniref:Uncharacterized protein n=1 Tax=Dorcoceras hygrometricum TaxID=472368 RepID=A0A2Z6ZV54_9LAMI|nr:hypothetical protein F511_45987 [Dorcoceras hygrometricum]